MASVLLLLLGAALAAPGLPARAPTDAVAPRLGKEITDFQATMLSGRADLGIPVLEPLAVESIPIDANSKMLKASGSISNLRVDGLSTFTVTTLQQTGGSPRSGRVALEVHIPVASASAEYDLRGKLMLGMIGVNLSGQSSVTAKVTGIKAGADLDITINNDDSVTVDNICNVHYSYDNANVHLNAMNGVVNGLINKIIPSILKSNEKTIKELIATLGKENINKYFDMLAGKPPGNVTPAEQLLAFATEHFVVPAEAQSLFMKMLFLG